jgi:signal transduction histidine kinase/CheY-like chemotaxis protein
MNLRPLHSIRLMTPVLVTIAVLPSLTALLYSGLVARNAAIQDSRQETIRLAQSMAATQERITASTRVMLSSLTLVRSVTALDVAACNALFEEIIKANPIYTNILLVNINGDTIASAVPRPTVNLADRKHFQDAVRNRSFSPGEFIVSRTTSEPAFPFAYPLLDQAGRARAVLVASVRLRHYEELISDTSLPDNSFYGIADHAGRRLFRVPDPSAGVDLGKPISRPLWAFVEAGGKAGVTVQDGSDGTRRAVAYSRLDMGPGTPAYMYMFAGVPEATSARSASAVMFRNAWLAGASWLLALLLSWVIGRDLFLKHVVKLTGAASRYGSGDFTTPTGVDHGAGELGRVAAALDQMAGQLRRSDEERDSLQQQLTQAQRLESVGRLAGGVAHDFNNMLMVILGHGEMLRDAYPAGNPQRASAEEILKAASKSADLTRQLLAFARKQTVAPVVMELNDTIAGMLKMLQRLIGENIRIVWTPDTAGWAIRIDPAQVDQVLANLAVNARDAIDGVGTITIATANVTIDAAYCTGRAECVPGDYVMLSVCDDGCGMDKATLTQVFEPFFTTKGPGKGTGLGLATVYGVVKQNGGFINVYSEPGKGTCFKVYFPRHAGALPEVEEELPAGSYAGRGERVLLVEDEESILRLGRSMLARLGYDVVATTSPSEALSLMSSFASPLRLLITDVVMPDMNGRELAARVRQRYPDVQCLYMSGYTSDVIAHQGVLDEGVHFIEKPFTLKALATKVRQVLDLPVVS